jgi:hypothetical protein
VKKVIEACLQNAQSMGVVIQHIVHKVCLIKQKHISNIFVQTDRPSSQYWNSGMARGHLELASDFSTSISHMSEQSCHNKFSDGENESRV